MILFFLCLIGFAACAASGDIGVIAVVLVLAGAVMLCASEERKDTQAWYNRREYWQNKEYNK